MSKLFKSEQYITQLPEELGKNKSIVLVGPSKYLEKEQKGSLIDQFDTVARIKGGFHMTTQPEIYGTKTDVIFQDALNKWYDFAKVHQKYQFNKIIYVYPPFVQHTDTLIRTRVITNYFQNKPSSFLQSNDVLCIEENYYRSLEKKNETIPTTGTVSLDIILNTPQIKFCYLTGFTFFLEEYNELYKKPYFKKVVKAQNLKYTQEKSSTQSSLQPSTSSPQTEFKITDPKMITPTNLKRGHDHEKMRINFIKKYLYHPKLYVDQYLIDMFMKSPALAKLIDTTKVKIFNSNLLD